MIHQKSVKNIIYALDFAKVIINIIVRYYNLLEMIVINQK